MKKNKLKAFMAEYDDDDDDDDNKDPKQYLWNMMQDYYQTSIVYRENKTDLREKLNKFIDIMMESDIETSYTVLWVVKEAKYAFSQRDWKSGFKTLDEAKEYALAKVAKKSFEYNGEEIAAEHSKTLLS